MNMLEMTSRNIVSMRNDKSRRPGQAIEEDHGVRSGFEAAKSECRWKKNCKNGQRFSFTPARSPVSGEI
jgi:hypothetical protein